MCDDKFCVTQRADVLPLTQSCPHEMGKVAANVMSSRKGNGSELPSAVRCSPSVCFAIAHRQLPRKRWRLYAAGIT